MAGEVQPGGDRLTVAVEQRADCVVVSIVGELDIYAINGVRTTLSDLLTDGATRVVADLTGVSFMDSSGLGVLVMAHKTARVRRGTFAIVCDDGLVRRLITLTGLVHVLRVFDSVEDAVAGTAP
jgi:anti-sigma B factor antagonist